MPTQMNEAFIDSLELEDLLRQLLNEVETGETKDCALDEQEEGTAVLFEVYLSGARYTLTRCLPAALSDATLSPREQEVARLVAKGLSNKAIATILDISVWTVSTHLRRIFTKLGVGSRAEMVTKVLQEGLLS